MRDAPGVTRRTVLKHCSLTSAGGMVALAGCGGGDGGGDGGTPTDTDTTISGLEPLDIPGDVSRDTFANHLTVPDHGAFSKGGLVVVRGTLSSEQTTTGEGTHPKVTATFLDADGNELGTDSKEWEQAMEAGEKREFTLRYSGTVSEVAGYELFLNSCPPC